MLVVCSLQVFQLQSAELNSYLCVVLFSLQHRRLLYDVFTKNYRVRRNIIQARLAQELGDVSKADIDRLLNVSPVLSLNVCLSTRCCPLI